MAETETFQDRLEALRLNPNAIEEVRVEYDGETKVIPNVDGKRGSLLVFSAITSNDGRISPEAARKGLGIFGEELRAEAKRVPGKHPNIDLLENIAETGTTAPCDVVRKDSFKPMPDGLNREGLERIAREFGTPFIIYDEKGIRQTLRGINSAFAWNPGFREFFAVKACPNPYILEICAQEGAGADCSSAPELVLADAVGMKKEKIMFTSNNTSADEFREAKDLGAIINFDDISHIPFFEKYAGRLPELACVRFNPGPERVGNSIIGTPEEAKYGLTRKQVFEAFRMMQAKGVKRFGLHTMVASNELNKEYHIETAVMLFELAKQVKQETGIDVEFVNTGGGWGVNYKPEQRPISPREIGEGVKDAYDRIVTANGLKPINILMENGRFVTGPNGWLVMRARHHKDIYRQHIGVDATMADFMRPGVYGAYHHLVVPGKENEPHNQVYDVGGSLCEGCDKFGVQRPLPKIETGDLVVLCDAGAHGRAMGFNYNAKLRCGELLLKREGAERIRRAETQEDYFATLNFPGSRFGDLAHDLNVM